MIVDSVLRPIRKPVAPGELIYSRHSGGPLLMIAGAPTERAANPVVVLGTKGDDDASQYSFRNYSVGANSGTLGTQWVLELRPNAITGSLASNYVEQPGVISYSLEGGARLAVRGLEGFGQYFDLSSFDLGSHFVYEALVFQSWAIWTSAEQKARPGARPLYDSLTKEMLF